MTLDYGKATIIGRFDIPPQAPPRRDAVMERRLTVDEKRSDGVIFDER